MIPAGRASLKHRLEPGSAAGSRRERWRREERPPEGPPRGSRRIGDVVPLPGATRRRRDALGCAAVSRVLFGVLLALLLRPAGGSAQHVLLEAEQFADLGGWDLDQQSMQVMGSPYLLAHGLGVPVRDAATMVRFPAAGTYRVWVRTRDWVAPWQAPGAPGRFRVLVNGVPLPETFGTRGAEWHWQPGGTVQVETQARIVLHDLTGFEGRCDALLFSRDPGFVPPDGGAELARLRRATSGLPEEAEDGGEFDLVVVGGGVAGACAALSAARHGLRVALIQDRPVLGGNSSSEVRVWPEGHTRQPPYPHIGDIVEELLPTKRPGTGNAKQGEIYEDQRKLDRVRAEPRIALLLEQRVDAVTARGGRLESVDAQHIRTARRVRLRAKLFADCTGDATVGFLAGADHEVSTAGQMGASNLWNVMDQSDPAQVLKCECKDKDALTISVQQGDVAAPFPRCPWAVDLTDKPFPGRGDFKGQWADTPLSNLGGWFWESGYGLDMVQDIERIRDLNFRAMYGAWDALKNVDKLYPNHRLGWAAFIAGKRESRRLLGDVVLTADDFRAGRDFPDGCFPCSWHIDVHTPHPAFDAGHSGNEFISRATTGSDYTYKSPYWAPYRALYSRNITNLFMAGRNISVTQEGLGPVRVMRTCGMMGEVVGKAAWICVRHRVGPRGVYEQHLPLLRELMAQPGALRRDRLEGALAPPPVIAAATPAPPRESRPSGLAGDAVAHRDLAYVPGGHERQKLDLFLPRNGTQLPLIINIHGGAFRMGSKEQGVPLAYLSQGYAVASINYRLSQHAKFPAQIEDCKAAVRWLRAHAAEYRLDPRRFAAWGSSAGGHLAAMLGASGDTRVFDTGAQLEQSSGVQAVVDYFGPTDFLQMDAHRLPQGMTHDPASSPESELIGGAIQENKDKTARANPITYVTPDDPPFLICHGDLDPLVPHHQSELLHAALMKAGVPVTFYTVRGAGHGGFKDPRVPELTREFLAKHLQPLRPGR